MSSPPLERKLPVLATCAVFSVVSLFAFFCSPIKFRDEGGEAAVTLVSLGRGGRDGGKEEEELRSWRAVDESGDGSCELFEGRWVQDEEYPLYESKNCRFIDEGLRCTENGRPDRLYTKWRWQPARCNLPRFDAKWMLEKLRNRRVVFAGDSIGRNQWESLLCMLSSSAANSKAEAAAAEEDSIYEVNGNPITKHKGFLVFRFRAYNCTLEYYRAPHLVRRGRPAPGSPETVRSTLKLDAMDWSAARWRDADLLVLNSGHWWNHEKTIRSGCYFQVGKEVKMQMSIESAYERSINTLLDWIHKEVNTTKTQVIFRTYSPAHSSKRSDGEGGGNCMSSSDAISISQEPWSRFLKPFARGFMELNSTINSAWRELDVLNITHMTAQRRDGHQSLYYLPAGEVHGSVQRQDCSHWCLPGVPDAWNELLYALFLGRELKINGTHLGLMYLA